MQKFFKFDKHHPVEKIPAAIIQGLYIAVQEACLPGIWSKGVALAREKAVRQDAFSGDEITLRVAVKERPVNPKVQLWPDDEDWFCDCGDKIQPCAHIAATVVALKNGQVQIHEQSDALSSGPQALPNAAVAKVIYRFQRTGEGLAFDRFLSYGSKQEILNQSLVSLIGGIQSGRLPGPAPSATKGDFVVDGLLQGRRRGVFEPSVLVPILAALADCSDIELDGVAVTILRRPLKVRARLMSEANGFRLRKISDPLITEVYKNGVALKSGALVAIENPTLSALEQSLLAGEGHFFSQRDVAKLVTEVLPALSQKIEVIIDEGVVLPQATKISPHIVLNLQKLSEQTLVVAPQILYGDPPLAQVGDQGLEPLVKDRVVLRDLAAERALAREIQTTLHLQLGQTTKFEGPAALEFLRKSQPWRKAAGSDNSTVLSEALMPQINIVESGFGLNFLARRPDGTQVVADPKSVFDAWKRGADHVSLLDGGWAPLPQDWLARYGHQVQALLASRSESTGKVKAYALPDLARLADDLRQPLPAGLEKMRALLEDFTKIPDAPLPADLTATLRGYQRTGVNWMCFLRELGMGALLADDMGLGKTLQALCALKGKTLIVSPTSVISSWAEHLTKFRPRLRVSQYYGSGRKLDLGADVILTSYGLLRLDKEALTAVKWGTVVLDEAQTIRNPESQVAAAAHSLMAEFPVALSGTPVENKPEDLWSIFEFLNKGLLGSRQSFQEQFADGLTKGQSQTVQGLRHRIGPFLLRRLKRDVAPELPPRTETVLHCDLSNGERNLYDAVLAASRSEVLSQIEADGKTGVFGALEALLRLRQACCHPRLLPTRASDSNSELSSSKLDLLIETLENSLGQQHRALIFSQWTSYLDLISARLSASGIKHCRLDGSTRDRAAVVEEFQDPNGPPVMIISLKAGGVGLTLTAADHIFIMDPWWNPAAEDQAADRAHRIGQTNPVMIYRLVARDTVEDKILALQKQKLAVAGAVLEGSAAAATLTKQDILALLQG